MATPNVRALDLALKSCAVVGTAGIAFQFCLYDVDGGERCVMFNRFGGVRKKEISEGTHFKVPWFNIPFIYDVKTRPKLITTTTGTKDLQTVSLTLRILFRPRVENLSIIHQTLGPDYDERVLPSIGNEILKATVAKYDAESLLTQREKVSQDIRDAITERANQFDIVLEDIAITHLQYGREFSKAIEEKQVAQQDAERVKFVVARVEQEKKAAVIKAEGEAEAAEMISQALKESGTGLIDMRRIDASRDIADILSKSPNVAYVPGGSNMLLNVSPGGK